jgi:hypothetical protein
MSFLVVKTTNHNLLAQGLISGGPTNDEEDFVKAVLFFYLNTTHLLGCSFVALKLKCVYVRKK